MTLEALVPVTLRLPHGDINLDPGQAVALGEDQATRLLQKAPGKLKAVESLAGYVLIWIDDEGPLPIAMMDTDDSGRTWVLVRTEADIRWVNLQFAKLGRVVGR